MKSDQEILELAKLHFEFAYLPGNLGAEVLSFARSLLAEPAGDERERIRDAIAETLGDAMDCTRVWSAWHVGTMSQDDFNIIAEDEDRLNEIVEAVMQARAAMPASHAKPDAEVVYLSKAMLGGSPGFIQSISVNTLLDQGTKLYAQPQLSREGKSYSVQIGEDTVQFNAVVLYEDNKQVQIKIPQENIDSYNQAVRG